MHQGIYSFFAVVVALVVLATAQDEPFFTSDNKVDCVNKMVDWCNSVKYPKEDSQMSLLSIAIKDESGNVFRIYCTSDSGGTNCTRNGSPWFSCNPDHQLIYKGTQLKKDSTDDVDDSICNMTKMAFNDIFIQNLSSNTTNQITTGMKEFFEMIADIQEQLDLLRRQMFDDCFPLCTRNLPNEQDPVTESSDSTATVQPNQLERE